MKRTITVFFFLFSFYASAQLFTGAGGPVLNMGQDSNFDLPVSGLTPSILTNAFGLEEVCININHPAVQELYIYLQSPDGRKVELTEGSSCNGVNYANTCFNNNASASITLGSAPYAGAYKPTGYLGRFNTGASGNGTWKLIVHDYLAFVDSGNVISWSIRFGNNPSPPVTFASSNLPILIINTNNQSISDNEILVDMGIIYNGIGIRNNVTDGWNNYNGKTMIHFRGSSSKNFEKKSFTLETRDASSNTLDVSLLGMPAESDWVLTASYTDKTLMRNLLSQTIFGQMGHYSPRFKNVEVIINNEYQGVYGLTEKPKRGKDRIDIAKLTATDNTAPDVTGGYILKIDRADEAGWYSLLGGNSQTNSKFYYQFTYPKDTAITSSQKTYIKNYMDEFETVMNSPAYTDLTNGYPKYIEESSFIDFFIVNELSKNVDAYRLSTYLYKDKITKGGKLHVGPVWDYDIAWHNCNYGNAFDPSGWQYEQPDTVFPSPTWWARFMQDPNFDNKLYCRWLELRQGILATNYLYNYIDATAAELNEAQQRNFIQWPTLGAYIFPNPQSQINANYLSEITDLKNWITNRISWLDTHIPGICPNIEVPEKTFPEVAITVFPNPFMNSFRVNYTIPQKSRTKLELINLIGEQAAVLFDEDKTQGTYQEEINTQSFSAGIYFIKLSVNDRVAYKKIIKLAE
jgi:spore coat protein CotH